MAIETGRRKLDRRAVLCGIASTATAAALPLRLSAQQQSSNTVLSDGDLTTVNDRVSVISGLGGNVVVHRSDSGLIVVDSGAAVHADTVLEAIETLAEERRIETLFNTHWHLDQIGANAAIRETGADIIAHARTLARLETPYYLPDEDAYRPAEAPEAHPTESFYAEGAIDDSGRSIRYGYLLEAHTDGDIYVRFVEDNLIAAGDAISPSVDPELDWYGGGWLGGRVDSLRLLLDISDSETKFVPSYGPVVDRDYVQAEHDLMLALWDIFFERVRAGESAADILASGALNSLDRQFDDPMKFLYAAHKGMWAHYNTLSHDIV